MINAFRHEALHLYIYIYPHILLSEGPKLP